MGRLTLEPLEERVDKIISIASVVTDEGARQSGYLGDAFERSTFDSKASHAAFESIKNFLFALSLDAWPSLPRLYISCQK